MERGPRGGNYESFESWRARQERPPETLKGEIEQMYAEAPTEMGREILGKILEMMNAKERAQKLASYIATADPKDITTYYPEKKLGIVLACDTTSPKDYQIGDTSIERGDKLLQLHIPPRLAPAGEANPLLTDLTESMQLTSDYIRYQGLRPKFVTGCTYEPLVKVAERRYGFDAVRVNIPDEWSERVRRVFHRYVDSAREPEIGFIYATTEEFQEKFPPRV